MTSEFNIAIHALVYLDKTKEIVSSEQLAQNICTNSARVRKVLAKLRKAEIIGSKGGPEGGYYLLEDILSIDLKTICEVVDIELINQSWKSGDVNQACLISSGMSDIMEKLYNELNEKMLKELSKKTIGSICKNLYK